LVTGGTRDTPALAVFVESATLVAITVTVCALLIKAGAVSSPAAEMLPSGGFRDKVIAEFELPATAAVNAWACGGDNVT
jgi:hypothetical protein